MLIKRFRPVLAVAFALVLIFGLGEKALAQPTERVPVFIGLERDLSLEKQDEIADDVVAKGGSVIHKYRIVDAVAARVPRWAIAKIRSRLGVKYVEEDAVVHAVQQTLPWGVNRIGADLVHTTGNKGLGVNVAIVDSGIDKGHPDLAANIAGGRNFAGWLWINPNNWDDDFGHGTHIAGIVAAVDNSQGVIGVAPESSLYAAKVLDANGMGFWSWVVAGIDWAVAGPDGVQGTDDDADVISMSLGGPYSQTVDTACKNAYEAGVVIVAAAGNESGPVIYPAALNSVIAVSATDEADNFASWSNFGPQIELAAPGVSIYSTMPTYHVTMNDQGYTQDYSHMSGTSMSTPHVSGTAALVIASGIVTDEDGSYGIANEVRHRMDTTAEDLGTSGWDFYYGHGLVDADEAVGAVPPEPNQLPWVEAGGPYSGEEESPINLGVEAGDADGSIVKYDWDWDGDGVYDETTSEVLPSHTWKDDFEGSFVVRVTDDDGATTTDIASVSVINVVPTAEAGGPYSGNEGSAITLSGSATDPGADILSYAWDLDGDGTYETLGQTVDYTWVVDGIYTVSLKVTDDDGGAGTDTADVTVKDLDPTADFAYSPTNPVVGEPVSFSDTSESYDGIVSWEWIFGDEQVSTEQNPSHTYTEAGTYLISLTVSEADADTSTVTQEIIVTEEAALPTMYVDDIGMSAETKTWRSWTGVRAYATVLVFEATGPLSGVTVYGHWSGAYNGRTVSGTTNGEGYVTFKTRWVRGGGTFTFTVDNLEKSGWEYDPSSNEETSDSITAP